MDNGIISHQHAWFWGMFLTDGGISHNKKGIPVGFQWNQKYDSYPILDALRDIIGSSHPIGFGAPPRIDGAPQYLHCTLTINSRQFADSIINFLHCDPRRKTFDLKFPSCVDAKYLPSLIRGIFEGDGCFAMESRANALMWIQICSANVEFLKCIQNCINEHCLQTNQEKGSITKTAVFCWNLTYYTTEDCCKITDWLFEDDYISQHMLFAPKHRRSILHQKLFSHPKMKKKTTIRSNAGFHER